MVSAFLLRPVHVVARGGALFRSYNSCLYFLHIPKTAGSSVTAWLTERVGVAETCPARTWDQLANIVESTIGTFSLFCGHFGWGFEDVVGRPLRVFTVFRDPLERTISHYRHVYRDVNHPRHSAVARQTFAEFVADLENRPMIENMQARYLVKNVLDPMRLFRHLDQDATKYNRFSTASEECRYLLDKGYVREMAGRHFDYLDVVGTTSDVGSFLDRVASKFGFPNEPSSTPMANVAPEDKLEIDVDEQSREIVRTLTEIDRELYERALALSQPVDRRN